ncbi:MAG TPA: alpha/beta hydrolase [Acidimicrobiia bacterium]|jgi:pimeloyl-ACP methyl ester carboxylesterase|nr:alpha/beta hydrolase [Acidimicrobiia bacterium]
MAVDYDEFGMFADNASEVGLPYSDAPHVTRESVPLAGDGALSALKWGTAAPELVLLHGGAQNAHTWDTVNLALQRPLVAIDMPGHGHSTHRTDHGYWPRENAAAVETAVRALAPDARLVVGMSLGGLTSIALAARAPDIVRALVLVDVTPGVNSEKASSIVQFVNGPESFASLDEILERTIAFNPTRTESSLRRGVLHNAVEQGDGTWRWRYDLPRIGENERPDWSSLWDDLSAYRGPLTLVRGAASPVVADEDVDELRRRRPDARVIVVEGAGHSVQGDQPLELAKILADALA